MTPEQIRKWLDQNLWRLDGPAQWLGTEPNTFRKPWESVELRWLLSASWPYFHSAGNQAIPAVYQAINDNPQCLADLSYLAETPRDMRIMEKDGVPVFGVESKHQMRDFDVVGTSISYMVLFMNFCNTGEAPIWMGDKSFKPISKVQAGDEVMGWRWEGKRRRLCRTRVLSVMSRQAPVVKATLESGRVIRCTPNHQWLSPQSVNAGPGKDSWTHVGGKSPEYAYRERTHKRTVHLGTLAAVIEPSPELTPEQQREADWLAGMFDGEGCAEPRAMSIAQSFSHNPEVCDRIERALSMLGIPYGVSVQKHGVRTYFLKGGRQTCVNWLNWTNGVKRARIDARITGQMLVRKDRVMKIEPDGVDTVYSMETESGNYVAWGLASKNCKHLSLSGIPLRWKDREAQGLENWPMVIIGGQAACAPGAMEPVVDCIWIGEVEDEPGNPGGISEVCDRIAEFKRDGAWQSDRTGCYQFLAREFNHLYFPRFTEVRYSSRDRGLEAPSKQISGIAPLLEGMRFPHRSRRVIDMDKIAPLRSAPLLYTKPGMGAGDVEVGRSCPAWCSFCRLALTTKPYRQRSTDFSIQHAREWKNNMGSVEMSPFSPDLPMHTQLKALLAGMLENVSDEVDGTAMRIDDLISDPDYVMLYTAGGANAITLGLEGQSQRMRNLVGKGTSDRDVEETVIKGIRAGITKFKFFMISQLPGEDPGDVMQIVKLGKRLDQIRAEMGVPGVRYQFSWTPLLIEAQTPFQWFAPTLPDHTLINVIEQLRPYRIECKIGTKAAPEKVALFQLCQRASRDVGEAIVDVLERHSVASWGGVPKTMREDLEAALRGHGFLNGLADCFDDRGRTDMFGWEHIDMGVSPQLLWNTHVQMVEFLQATSSETYDEEVPDWDHGSEWIGRCDQHCEGSACRACEPADFRKRREYIAAGKNDRDIRTTPVQPIDLSTIACKVRMRLRIPPEHCYATNDHWRFALRRAAYRATEAAAPFPNIAKRSIVFASDAVKVRDWSYGVEYAEFGLTAHASSSDIQRFMMYFSRELKPWLEVQGYDSYHARAELPAAARALYEVEVEEDPDSLEARLAAWERAEAVPLTLTGDTAFFGTGVVEVDAKELVSGARLVRQGHRMLLRFYAQGKAGPYQLAGAILGMPSHLALQRLPAERRGWFYSHSFAFEAEECLVCGEPLPVDLLGCKVAAAACPMCALSVMESAEVLAVS